MSLGYVGLFAIVFMENNISRWDMSRNGMCIYEQIWMELYLPPKERFNIT